MKAASMLDRHRSTKTKGSSTIYLGHAELLNRQKYGLPFGEKLLVKIAFAVYTPYAQSGHSIYQDINLRHLSLVNVAWRTLITASLHQTFSFSAIQDVWFAARKIGWNGGLTLIIRDLGVRPFNWVYEVGEFVARYMSRCTALKIHLPPAWLSTVLLRLSKMPARHLYFLELSTEGMSDQPHISKECRRRCQGQSDCVLHRLRYGPAASCRCHIVCSCPEKIEKHIITKSSKQPILFQGNTPALRTLILKDFQLPWNDPRFSVQLSQLRTFVHRISPGVTVDTEGCNCLFYLTRIAFKLEGLEASGSHSDLHTMDLAPLTDLRRVNIGAIRLNIPPEVTSQSFTITKLCLTRCETAFHPVVEIERRGGPTIYGITLLENIALLLESMHLLEWFCWDIPSGLHAPDCRKLLKRAQPIMDRLQFLEMRGPPQIMLKFLLCFRFPALKDLYMLHSQFPSAMEEDDKLPPGEWMDIIFNLDSFRPFSDLRTLIISSDIRAPIALAILRQSAELETAVCHGFQFDERALEEFCDIFSGGEGGFGIVTPRLRQLHIWAPSVNKTLDRYVIAAALKVMTLRRKWIQHCFPDFQMSITPSLWARDLGYVRYKPIVFSLNPRG
ncbi:hypothetical protein SISNIDRAFT_283701 [Sistotremastrum niveocremeum HHB9708]|uniref:Uncharacterized protein n=1 Tax=Sistotremastrum niveocremeum HHB9708 TaxID=1314777 RepID=A0A164Y8W4_9AGAM|nr:hypothetical protein SISNIDRAFT_283701 [Sistotremastrum niveocremeum HHB9708]